MTKTVKRIKDWRLMLSKYDGTCQECKKRFSKGTLIVWLPNKRKALCTVCAGIGGFLDS